MMNHLLTVILLAATWDVPAPAPASQPGLDWRQVWGWVHAKAEWLSNVSQRPEKHANVTTANQPASAPAAVNGLFPSSNSAAYANLGVGVAGALLVGLVPLGLAMLTSYIRISVVLALLRTGLAAPGVPPLSVQTGLAILLTGVVMAPVVERVWTGAVAPVMAGQTDAQASLPAAMGPVRSFMIRQIDATGQHGKVRMFTDRAGLAAPKSWDDVPTSALVPGYCLAELHVAFQIGVRLLIPFLVLDLIVAAVLVSLGLFLVPPTLVSLPLKLLLFIAADGWALVAGNLLKGFA